MSEEQRCQRCRNEFTENRYTIRMNEAPSSEPAVSIVVCDYCRKSFDGWVARQKRRSSSSSSSRSSSPSKPMLLEEADREERTSFRELAGAQESSRSREESSPRERSSSRDSLSARDRPALEVDSIIGQGGKLLLDSAKEGWNAIAAATRSGPTRGGSERSSLDGDEDSNKDDDEYGVDVTSNYLVTFGVVLGVFIVIGLVLSFVLNT